MAIMGPTLRLAVLLIAFILFGVAKSQSTEPSQILPRELPVDNNGKLECQTARAADYYGLGVRLGVYFAWLQAYIANTLLPSEISGALDTNTIFLLTILIAMIKCSSINMMEQVDALILMHLSGGTIFGIFSIWGYRTIHYTLEGPRAIKHYGGFGTHARLILCLAVSIFGLWFWMFAVTGALSPMGPQDDPPNSDECATLYTFMFAKVRADGGIRIFYIFICICCTIYFGIMLLVSTLAGYARAQKMIALAKSHRWANSTRLRYATGFNYRELQFLFKYLRWGNLIWIVFSVLLIEFSLNFNHVTAVLGGPNDNELHLPAQLLPLLIGAFGFIRICYLTLEDWRNPTEHDPSTATFSEDAPPRTQSLRLSSDIFHVFSPTMATEKRRRAERDGNEIDELEKHDSLPVRYLVSWLPWLSLLRSANRKIEDSEKTADKSVDNKLVESPEESPERTREEVKKDPVAPTTRPEASTATA